MLDRSIIHTLDHGIVSTIPAVPVNHDNPLFNVVGGDATFSGVFKRLDKRADLGIVSLSMNERTELAMQHTGTVIQSALAAELWGSLEAKGVVWTNACTGLPAPAASPTSIDYTGSLRESLVALSRNLRYTAQMSNLTPAEWVILMHPVTWYETAVMWPSPWMMTQHQREREWECGYCGTNRQSDEWKCSPGCGGSRDAGWICLYCGRSYSDEKQICWDGVDGCGAISSLARVESVNGLTEALGGEFNDWVLHENKVPIDGFLYDVVVDMALREGDVWVLPTKILGGASAMTREYVDARNALSQSSIPTQDIFWSDGGQYLWSAERVKRNATLSCTTRQRLVPRVPHLIGRLRKHD